MMYKNYDKNIMYDLAKNNSINDENIEFLIKAFSYFMSNFNKDYVYNRTYLPSYFGEFIECRNSITEKERMINEIISELEKKYSDQDIWDKVILKFDSSWEFYSKDLHRKTIAIDRIMKKEIYLECIYHVHNEKDDRVIDYYESDTSKEIIERISEFIDLIINEGDESK